MERSEIEDKASSESAKNLNNPTDTSSSKPFKNKNIKKKRKRRSEVHLKFQSNVESTVAEFVLESGRDYFQLTDRQARQSCILGFKSNVHIRDYLGSSPNIFNLKNNENHTNHAKQYFRQLRQMKSARLQAVALSNHKTSVSLGCLVEQSKEKAPAAVELLSMEQFEMLSQREGMIAEVEHFMENVSQSRPQVQIDGLSKELLNLCKFNFNYQNQLSYEFERIIARDEGRLYNLHQQNQCNSLKLQKRYCQILVKKNLRLSFDERPIEYINYFRQIEVKQKSPYNDQKLLPLVDLEEFRYYLKDKKFRRGKLEEDSLKTCCSSCFSNHSESYNPIERCKECGMRMHRLCHSIRLKCEKCKYIRKTAEEKKHVPYCFICDRESEKGLSLEILNDDDGEYYAHTFCLLISKFWVAEDNEIVFEVEKPEKGNEICKICQKTGMCIKSECCGEAVHGMCAFLEGYSFSLDEAGDVKVECCREAELQRRLSFDRKFRLNFEKNLYRETDEAIGFIESQ